MQGYLVLSGESTSIKNHFEDVRRTTEQLCKNIAPEDSVIQATDFVSPPKWHLAHTTWFFENFILKKYITDYQPHDEVYDFLFNSYYQSQGEMASRNRRGLYSRPLLQNVLLYRKKVNELVSKLIPEHKDDTEFELLLRVGINHEQQHQELLISDLKYSWSFSPMNPRLVEKQSGEVKTQSKQTWLYVEKGLYEIGHDSGQDFCYDNETPVHKVYLNAFEISSRAVTNREYLDFINNNGYKWWKYWLDDGWTWVQDQNVEAPLYWRKKENHYEQYTLCGWEKINLDAPVTHVSFYEADAFAQYKGMRLPTEQEWEVAARMYKDNSEGVFQYSFLLQPQPQHEGFGFLGNVWEWTNSAYLPYPGYKKWEGGVGEYNGKFMVNQMALRGGSCATPKSHIRTTFRNFFQPHHRWQFTGIRLAK